MIEWLAQHENGPELLVIAFLLVATISWFIGLWCGEWITEKMFLSALRERPIQRWPDGTVVGYTLHLGRFVIAHANNIKDITRKKEKFIEEVKQND